ncbi:hypothetical protein HY450_01000 [Candidatus Pacearchaeota archaeon]|nr:hypothetical protein [Candidatus Pacearchaeota archaeon]
MKQKQEFKLREEFLLAFVRTLIDKSYVPEPKKESPQEQVVLPNKNVKIDLPRRIPVSMTPQVMMPPQIPLSSPQGKENINIGKITQILLDPSVFSVECPGPNKNLLVNRSGVIQTSKLMMTNEQIKSLMEEFSEKTRIPLIESGLFKALFQDLLFTAVVSEFVGTRFIIQKRTPFQRY